MNIKKHITCIIAAVTLFAFTSSSVHADINLGNDDGTDFKGGTSNNYWGVYTDGGVPLNDTEGLRVTVYHAVTKDRKSTRLNSSHYQQSRMPSSA